LMFHHHNTSDPSMDTNSSTVSHLNETTHVES
jgi:hypothetical protein